MGGNPSVRKYKKGPDKSINSNSILARLDYKDVRILLTGDLNTFSQYALLTDYDGQHEEFSADGGKGLPSWERRCLIYVSGENQADSNNYLIRRQ